MRTGKDFGLQGVLADRPLIPVKTTDRPLSSPNEELVQTISFLMDNMRTRNRRDGDYRQAHGGMPPLFRYMHPELHSAGTATLLSILNLIAQPARPADWERLTETAIRTDTPVFQYSWATGPIYGNEVRTEDGESMVSKQTEVFLLACASVFPENANEQDLTAFRNSYMNLKQLIINFPDAGATAGPMFVSAVRETAVIKSSVPPERITGALIGLMDRIRTDLGLYCTGGARELPFALRFTGEGLQTVWNRWNAETDEERLRDVQNAIMNRLCPYRKGNEPFRELLPAFSPEAERNWKACDEQYRSLTVIDGKMAVQNRKIPDETYVYRMPDSEEALQESMKTPFRMQWIGPEQGITRMYVNADGFACERHTSAGTDILVLENQAMYRKGMSEGYSGIMVLKSGIYGKVSDLGKPVLELTGMTSMDEDLMNKVQKWWNEKSNEFRNISLNEYPLMPDDEKAVLARCFNKTTYCPLPSEEKGRAELRPDLHLSTGVSRRSAHSAEGRSER